MQPSWVQAPWFGNRHIIKNGWRPVRLTAILIYGFEGLLALVLLPVLVNIFLT